MITRLSLGACMKWLLYLWCTCVVYIFVRAFTRSHSYLRHVHDIDARVHVRYACVNANVSIWTISAS